MVKAEKCLLILSILATGFGMSIIYSLSKLVIETYEDIDQFAVGIYTTLCTILYVAFVLFITIYLSINLDRD